MEESTTKKKGNYGGAVYIAPLVCLLVLGILLNTTNPLQAGPASILIVFVVIYLFIFSVLVALLNLVEAVRKVFKPRHVLSLRKGYYLFSVISLAPVLLIALNTLGQLGALEFILIALLVFLGCFYVVRRSAK